MHPNVVKNPIFTPASLALITNISDGNKKLIVTSVKVAISPNKKVMSSMKIATNTSVMKRMKMVV
eukprot:CAMPEP_0170549528 /NCGR_PEP_ID=MMETSP0211-20121228/7671_1 /TAXON_ID=311385 /ORGANISM="Pseudokeronopsis sp., Strain OXSARD2" /LENGTH=64 /DNA_ID=CAMNT_0010855583 /DNA_START=13 /DNA_END=210 /DNA_ORIENTATION=+